VLFFVTKKSYFNIIDYVRNGDISKSLNNKKDSYLWDKTYLMIIKYLQVILFIVTLVFGI